MQWLLLLQGMGCRAMGFNICAPNSNSCCLPTKHSLNSCAICLSCSVVCGVFLDKGLNLVSCIANWSFSFFLFCSSLLKLISKIIYTVMNFCSDAMCFANVPSSGSFNFVFSFLISLWEFNIFKTYY